MGQKRIIIDVKTNKWGGIIITRKIDKIAVNWLRAGDYIGVGRYLIKIVK